MRVIQAPNKDIISTIKGEFFVFLAGGITSCYNWQDKVIETLYEHPDLADLVIFNPRRDNFDIEERGATYEQILWERKYLKKCDLVSYFFDASESVQPITLYELGKYGDSKDISPIITVVEGYKRQNDVLIQTALSGLHANVHATVEEAIYEHARAISDAYLKWRYNHYEI